MCGAKGRPASHLAETRCAAGSPIAPVPRRDPRRPSYSTSVNPSTNAPGTRIDDVIRDS